jgi:uncharacterized protein (DUF1697 family)
MRYVALLRGINVGGNTMIKMEELRKMLEDLGFRNVASYINSGNLAFDVPKSTEEKLVTKIEKAIEKDFGTPVPVMVREQKDMERIIAANPFYGEYGSPKEMHVLFLKEEMPKEKRDQLLEAATAPERFEIKGREIYCHLLLGVANSLLGKSFIEKKLKLAVTGRNWRTVEKLTDL